MDFSDFAIQEVVDMSIEIIRFIKTYSDENLKGFTGSQKLRIQMTAISNILSNSYIVLMQTDAIDIDRIKKIHSNIIEYAEQEVKIKK